MGWHLCFRMFQTVRESTEWTSKEMKSDSRCSLISPGSLGQEGKKVGISYRLHFIVSSEKPLPIPRGGHAGLGKQRLDSSFALCGLFCCLTGKLHEGGRYHPELPSTSPASSFRCTVHFGLKMEEKAEGEESSGGLQVSQYKNSPQCCPLEELETINKDGRYCGGQRRHP